MKVTNKQKIGTVWVLQCPLCGKQRYSASEPDFLPDFFYCDCDKNGNKQSVYELFEIDGKQMIRRNKFPRFVGEVVFGELSDIEHIEWLDECSISDITSALRKAGAFLIKSSRNGKTSQHKP